MKKMCWTTHVFGQYIDFIPMFIFFIKKAYPDVLPVIFVTGKGINSIKKELNLITQMGDYKIINTGLKNFPKYSQFGKAYRWLLYDEIFEEYETIYYGDIDIFAIKEPIHIYEQHIAHCSYLDLPYSNISRESILKFTLNKPLLKSLLIEKTSIKSIIRILKHPFYRLNKLSGLHFVKREEYFLKLSSKIELYKELLNKRDSFLNNKLWFNNETFLYLMMEDLKIGVPKETLRDDILTLDFNNYKYNNFRPHHGIHIGIFNAPMQLLLNDKVLNSNTYHFYFDEYSKIRDNDILYSKLYNLSSDFIKEKIDKLNKYLDNF